MERKKIETWQWSLGNKCHGNIFTHEYNGEKYYTGVVFTKYGIVAVYSQGGESSVHATRFDIVKDGKVYTLSIKKKYTKVGLARLANKFAKQVFEEN